MKNSVKISLKVSIKISWLLYTSNTTSITVALCDFDMRRLRRTLTYLHVEVSK